MKSNLLIGPLLFTACFEVLASGATWSSYGGTSAGEQFHPAVGINRNNVRELEIAWTYRTGELSDGSDETPATLLQVTPIQFEDSLVICTAYNDIVALDASTGRERWRYRAQSVENTGFYGSRYCRGVSLWVDPATKGDCSARIFQAALDGVIHAVDARTGSPCTGFGRDGKIALNELEYCGEGRIFNTSPPAVAGDTVIVGGAFYDNMFGDTMDGIVRGFDVRTGQIKWSWNPIPSHLSKTVGGANAWAPLAVDEARGWVFLPTGSPSYDVLGVYRKDPIPHANAVVALDTQTGELIWSFQTVHHDLWDYDLASMPTLTTIDWEGERRDVVVQGTKQGLIFVLDRETGESIFPFEERAVPASDVLDERASPTQPVPTQPPPVTSQSISEQDAWGLLVFDKLICRNKLKSLRNEGMFTPPSLQGSLLHPSFLGGVNWGGIAVDPGRQLAVVNSSNLAASVTLIPRAEFDREKHLPDGFSHYEMRGAPYVLVRGVLRSPLGAPCNPPPWGHLTAIDLRSGDFAWQVPFGRTIAAGVRTPKRWGSPNQGGPLVTGSGLVFIGASPDSRLRAYDIDTGSLLWEGALPAPAFSSPMAYLDSTGRQYIVIAAGGSPGFETELDNAIVAFALPEVTE